MLSESESSDDEGLPPFKLVSSDIFRRLAELAPAAAHNQPLTDSETQAAKSMEEATKLTAFATRETIVRIDAQMNTLLRKRRELIGEANTQSSVLQLCEKLKAPIRRISQEIIREIALYSLPLRPTPSHHNFPLTFSQVCSTWRNIALSTPRIWSTLYLTIKSPASFSMYSELVREWLKRGNPIPASLSIYFRLTVCDIMQHEVELHKFLTSLSQSVVHVHHLGFGSFGVENLQAIFNQPLEWTLPALHQLDLSGHGTSTSGITYPFSSLDGFQLFRSTPILKNMILDTVICDPWEPPHFVPWEQLTRICLSQPTRLQDWIAIMRTCTDLQTCIVKLTNSHAPAPVVITPPTHNLRNLSMELVSKNGQLCFVDILHLFQFTKLTKLDLLCPGQHTECALVPGSQNVQTFPSLTHLSVSGPLATQERTFDILSATENLVEFSVTASAGVSSYLIEHLTHTVGRLAHRSWQKINLPRLSTLRIDLIDDDSKFALEDIDMLKGMFLSRLDGALPSGCQRLERVLINTPDPSTGFFLKIGLLEWSQMIGLQVDINQLGPHFFPKLYVPCVAPFSEVLWGDKSCST